MSADMQWLVIRNNSRYLLKRNGVNLTMEPNNLKNRNSFRYNGLVHKKTIGVEPCADGKGVTMVTGKSKGWRKPSANKNRVDLKKNSRRTLNTLRKTIVTMRPDLKMAALRRASAIIRSQRPVVVKKSRGKKA